MNESYFVAVKITPDKYKHFKVDEAVITYIRQLELAIKYRKFESVEMLYPERFKAHG